MSRTRFVPCALAAVAAGGSCFAGCSSSIPDAIAILDSGADVGTDAGTNTDVDVGMVDASPSDAANGASPEASVEAKLPSLNEQVAAGGQHTCASLSTGNVRCWGHGTFGQLGYGNMKAIGDDETPASAGDVDVGGTVLQLTAGWYHTIAQIGNQYAARKASAKRQGWTSRVREPSRPKRVEYPAPCGVQRPVRAKRW